MIIETFKEDAQTALAVARCESNLNPKAYNGNNTDGSVDKGLYQINSVHYKRMEQLGLDVWKATDNVKFAKILHDEQGFAPWVCYKKLAYSL